MTLKVIQGPSTSSKLPLFDMSCVIKDRRVTYRQTDTHLGLYCTSIASRGKSWGINKDTDRNLRFVHIISHLISSHLISSELNWTLSAA